MKRVQSWLFVTIQILCICVILFTGAILIEKPIWLALALAGLALGVWALWTMRLNNLSVLPDLKENSNLVRHGPYRYVRHPMYSAVLLITLALVIHDFSPSRLLIWVILFVDLFLKLRYEERLLVERFEEYGVYMLETKRLIPFLY